MTESASGLYGSQWMVVLASHHPRHFDTPFFHPISETFDAAKFEIQTLPRLIFPNEILQIQSFTDFFDASTVKSRSEDR